MPLTASTAPAFRLWTPTGDVFPGVGASAVGFGKALTDVDTKWFNKDAWRVESFLKRDKSSAMWIDPAAIKDSKKSSVSATFGYDDMERNIKYRGTTDDSLKHTSEIATTLPLMDGEQRFKAQVATTLEKDTFLPKIDATTVTKLFWKAMLPAFTTEAIVSMTTDSVTGVNAWIQADITKDLAVGGFAKYDVAKGALSLWEAGALQTTALASGVVGLRAVTRNAEEFELGCLPPATKVAGYNTQLYFKANHSKASQKTELATTAEVKVCKELDLKVRTAFDADMANTTAVSAIWSAPGGWRVAASLANFGQAKQAFGLRLAQGSTPPPL